MSATQALPNNPARDALRPYRARIAELQDAFALIGGDTLIAAIDAAHKELHREQAKIVTGRAA